MCPSLGGLSPPPIQPPPPAATITHFIALNCLSLSLSHSHHHTHTHTHTHQRRLANDAKLNASFDCRLSHRNTLNATPDAVTRRYASIGVAQCHPCNSTRSSGKILSLTSLTAIINLPCASLYIIRQEYFTKNTNTGFTPFFSSLAFLSPLQVGAVPGCAIQRNTAT